MKYENEANRTNVLSAFDRLILPEGHKDMVQSLVTQHFREKRVKEKNAETKEPDAKTDLIRGKGELTLLVETFSLIAKRLIISMAGQGLIILLHGAPGVGKTTTAGESGLHTEFPIASYVSDILVISKQRVLQRLSRSHFFKSHLVSISWFGIDAATCLTHTDTHGTGDLGTTASDVQDELEKNFTLASRWDCILLLDEAEVFLASRDRKDFQRNGLVAGKLCEGFRLSRPCWLKQLQSSSVFLNTTPASSS